MNKESWNKIWIVTIYAIAMGFLEATVVIYLRKIYYVNGFDFPLKGFIEPQILGIEWVREFATMVMLVTIGMLAGKKFYDKFAFFLYSFAIWDIFYYVFLKVYLNWPSSFMTWDLLFLIPWPWIGPVLAPLLCTILMIATAFMIINFSDRGIKIKFNLAEWTMILLGIAIVLYTWLWDYGKLIIGGGFAGKFFTLANNPQFISAVDSYIPGVFNWPVFLIGFVISSIGVIKFYLRTRRRR